MHRFRQFRRHALFAAAVFVSVSAMADPKVIQSAQRLLAAGNAKQAYTELIAVSAQLAGNIEFDYLLGVAALDSGKIDEAIIAFERVLAVNPNHAGAKLDLARAYYTSGAFDLAEATFENLKLSNPPPLALQSINRYLAAIRERKKQGRSGVTGYGELNLGYDTNLTGVPGDFSNAVLNAFGLPGVDPTGNSVKRKAPFVGAQAGMDYFKPLARGISLFAGLEGRGRAYRKEPDFNLTSGELRLGATLNQGPQQWRLSTNASRFRQDGQAPGEPRPTNDRDAAGLALDWRLALNQRNQIGAAVQVSRQRFPDNSLEDFDQVLVSASWLRSFEAKGVPLLYLTAFHARDEADNKLPDGVSDKSKRISALRGYMQYSSTQNLQLFSGVGYTQRKDQSAFARATQVEFGRDRMADLSLGFNWKFQPSCTLRAQWLFSKNDSNIAIYDYTRSEVSSAVRCEFE
ncbi:MAG: tetratricopeptide repeat protein [Betaproteobacteria bacterium]|nr:tetratricopeptide repeat protein [Betaproteobacteria bacterium]